MTGKVAALITRPSPSADGLEILLFQHPSAGVQIPAGSLYDGEDPTAGFVREAGEETGLVGDALQLVGEVAQWPNPGSDLIRHVFHLRCLRETPEEWWVVTPDGDGLCWRCHWRALDGAEPIHHAQRWWLDRTRHALVAGEEPLRVLRPRSPLPGDLFAPTTVEVCVDDRERGVPWYSVTWLPGDDSRDQPVTQAQALCVTADGDAVLVTTVEGRDWMLPGGTTERGETARQTLEREVWEEACAKVVDAELLGTLRVVALDAAGNVTRIDRQTKWWARVDVEPWRPEFETVERRVVPYTDILGVLHPWRFPENEHWLVAAMEAERRSR